jgi:hypothetical protein
VPPKPPGEILKNSLQDLPVFADWSAAAQNLLDVRETHPTHGKELGFDRFNLVHLVIQTALVKSMKREQSLRPRLKLEIAEPSYDGLDIIGKLAVLDTLDSFMPVLGLEQRYVVPGEEGDTLQVFLDRPTSPLQRRDMRPVPRYISQLMGVAGLVDSQLRLVDSHLRTTGSQVSVEASGRWGEPVFGQLKGGYQTFSYEAQGKVEDKQHTFPLEHPVISGDKEVIYVVPSKLRDVAVGGVKSEPHNGYLGMVERKSNLDVRWQDSGQVMDVPLLGVMQARGLDISMYSTPFEGDQGNSLIVKLDKFTLPQPVSRQGEDYGNK